jgi:hypothetical protein
MVASSAEKVFGAEININEAALDALDAMTFFQHMPGDTPPDFYAPLAMIDFIFGGCEVI